MGNTAASDRIEHAGFIESVPTFALGMSMGLLLIPLVRGSTQARLSAAVLLVGTLGGTALLMLWTRRTEYGPDRTAPPFWDLMKQAFQGAARSLPLWAVWGASLIVIFLTPNEGRRPELRWAGNAIAVALAAGIAVALLSGLRGQLRGDGIEAAASRRGAVAAFFSMAVISAGWSVLEGLVDAPQMRVWVPATIGVLVWQVGYWVELRRAAG